MTMPDRLRWSRPLALVVGVIAIGMTVACSGAPDATPADTASAAATSPQEPEATTRQEPTASPGAGAVELPSAHVHSISRDPGSGRVVVAAHDGLYVYEGTTPERVGPVIDLMGFTVAGPGHFYASGHPGTGTELPQPVGLIESRDGGRTWAVLSRGGRSDFHALTTAGQTVIGFDGAVRATADGRTWTDGNLDSYPRTLAGSRTGTTVLATAEEGVMRSTDGGRTWQRVDQAPRLLMTAFGEADAVVGLTPSGQVHTSADAGRTWHSTQLVAPDAQALHVSGHGEDQEILVASGRTIITSTGGRAFEPLR